MLYTSFCFLFALFFGCQLMVGFGVYYEPSFGNLYSCIKSYLAIYYILLLYIIVNIIYFHNIQKIITHYFQL